VSERIRVLEVLASGAVGGGSTHLRGLATGLDPERFDLLVVCSDDGPLAADLEQAGLRVERVPMTRTVNPGAMVRLAGLMRRHPSQIVHYHGTRAGLAAAPAAALMGVPGLYTVHGWSFHSRGSRLQEDAARSIEQVIARMSRRVICVSHADRHTGLSAGILQGPASAVIPNGIDPERFSPQPQVRAHMRQELGVRPEEALFGLFGRLTRQKGQRTFLLAARRVLDRFGHARFVLVGDGEDRPMLEALKAELGLGDRVIFTGFRPDVPELLNALDAFVLPSLWEGLPIALLEAMAVGVPVIASSVDGSAEVIQPGTSGLLVPAQDVASLVAAMDALLETPALAERLAKAGLERVRHHYTLAAMVRSTERMYRDLMAAQRLATA